MGTDSRSSDESKTSGKDVVSREPTPTTSRRSILKVAHRPGLPISSPYGQPQSKPVFGDHLLPVAQTDAGVFSLDRSSSDRGGAVTHLFHLEGSNDST